MTSASCRARSALKVSSSGSPGPAPTSDTKPGRGRMRHSRASARPAESRRRVAGVDRRGRPAPPKKRVQNAPRAATPAIASAATAAAQPPAQRARAPSRAGSIASTVALMLPREHGCRALGADGDDDGSRSTIAGVMKSQSSWPVDDVDRHAGRPAHRHGPRRLGIVVERDVGQPDTGEVTGDQRARLERDGTGRCESSISSQGSVPARGSAPWSWQQPELLRRLLAAADDQHRLMIQVQEYRKEAHPSPNTVRRMLKE